MPAVAQSCMHPNFFCVYVDLCHNGLSLVLASEWGVCLRRGCARDDEARLQQQAWQYSSL
eukprot:scaffold41215_cov22-Tisochrysis_lutea.AAC.2